MVQSPERGILDYICGHAESEKPTHGNSKWCWLAPRLQALSWSVCEGLPSGHGFAHSHSYQSLEGRLPLLVIPGLFGGLKIYIMNWESNELAKVLHLLGPELFLEDQRLEILRQSALRMICHLWSLRSCIFWGDPGPSPQPFLVKHFPMGQKPKQLLWGAGCAAAIHQEHRRCPDLCFSFWGFR